MNEIVEQRLGKYEIIAEIGSGGFAAVYRAHDTVLKRDVALKILHPALLADPDFVTRFENDARAAAQLDHSHIVTVHDLGQLEGRLYIAMQLLPGGTLAERIKREGPLSFAAAVEVVRQVAGALDYAHQHGFVHRDVKPTNILFNAHGEAVVTDFGLVKAAESSVVARSTAGGVIGTPAYIAPEAWEGKAATPATDVYALGCVLFEMLTGEPMFQGDTSPAVMMAHFQPHEYPAQWSEGVPPEVKGLLERALVPDPADRYSSAGAFAADLQALAALAADPLAESYRALRAAVVAEEWEQALQLAQEIATQDPDYRDVSALRQQAAEAQARAKQAQWAAQWREQALAAEQAGQLDAARVAAQRWLEMAPGNVEAQALLERLTVAPSVEHEAVSPPEVERMVAVEPVARPVAKPLRRPEPPAKRRRVPGWVWALGALVVVGGIITLLAAGGGLMALMDEEENLPVDRATATLAPTSTQPLPTDTPTPVPLDLSVISPSNVAQVREVARLGSGNARIVSIAWLPNGQLLALTASGFIDLYEPETLVRTRLAQIGSYVSDGAFSPDGETLASMSIDYEDNAVYLWRVSDGTLLDTLEGHTGFVNSPAFSPDGEVLASGGHPEIHLWRVSDRTLLHTLTMTPVERNLQAVNVTFSSDATLLASARNDGRGELWRVSDGALIRTLPGHITSSATIVAFSPDDTSLVSAAVHELWLLRTSDGAILRTLEVNAASVSFSPDGQILASADGEEGMVRLWQVSDGSLMHTLEGHTDWASNVAFSPDGAILASESNDGTIRLWGVPRE